MVHSLLDGPSLAGAFRFAIRRTTGTVMEIEKHLFVRQDIERLGIAPLTSMFWFGEYGRERLADGRPEVHDSDGLVIWNGAGERIFRPLNNPTRIFQTSYLDNSPKGFGLTQRDRDFDHYLDGVGYEKRPTVWVEPMGDWGKGMVQLVEIPTDDEIHDNICAYWLADKPTRAGDALSFRYRLHWLDAEPDFPVACDGQGGRHPDGPWRRARSGKPRPSTRPSSASSSRAEPLARLPDGVLPEPVIWTSRGTVLLVQMEGCRTVLPATGGCFSTSLWTARSRSRCALFLRARHPSSDRDLALPVRAAIDRRSQCFAAVIVAAAAITGLIYLALVALRKKRSALAQN